MPSWLGDEHQDLIITTDVSLGALPDGGLGVPWNFTDVRNYNKVLTIEEI